VAQREHKMAQFERMLAYRDAATCRMAALVRYFGDTEDTHVRCGTCDFCNPGAAVAQRFRDADQAERTGVLRILEALKKTSGVATGRLHTQVFADGQLGRREFEELLAAAARSGLVEMSDASFEKDGKKIDFRKVRITPAGRQADETAPLLMPAAIEVEAPPKKRKKARKGATPAKPAKAAAPKPVELKAEQAPPQTGKQASIEAALREWRLAEAKRRGVPAFRILTDRALQAIAARQPQTTRELLEVSGVGLTIVEKYGARIFQIVAKG
jgi:DNA topoisomerase-3